MKRIKIYTPILIVGIGLLFASCGKEGGSIKGSGPVVQQEFDLPYISAISLSIDANVKLTYGDTQMVMIEGQQNIINNIEKYVSDDGYWNIGYIRSVRNHAGITIYITTPHIDYATISGSGSMQCQNNFPDSSEVYLKISGSGRIYMNTIAHIVESDISGSGEIYLSGRAHEHQIRISGSGSVRAFEMITNNTYVEISGSGNSEVFAEDLLDVKISGSGNVFYKGNPLINANISGSGGIFNSN